MNLTDVLSVNTIDLSEKTFHNREEAFRYMASTLYRAGTVSDIDGYIELLEQREALGSTYMGDSLAVPHGKGSAVLHNSAALCKCAPFTYESCGESGEVSIIMMLAITDQFDDAKYLSILSSLARLLMNDDFRQAIESSDDAQQIIDIGEAIMRKKES